MMVGAGLAAWKRAMEFEESMNKIAGLIGSAQAQAAATDQKLPYAKHDVTEEDIQAVVRTLRSDWLTTGPVIEEFEAALCAATGSRYAVAVSSGTAALHLAYLAAGIGPGDEVIVPTLTFAATANAVLYCGARPVLCDVGQDLTLDPQRVGLLVGGTTSLIASVDFAGLPAQHALLGEIAEAYTLGRVNDAAHSLGASDAGKPLGRLAPLTILSFHPVKHITTGEGGAVLTNLATIRDLLCRLRNHGQQAPNPGESWFRQAFEVGYNYRLSAIGAALGLSQLKRLPENVARRRELAARYDELLGDIDGLTLPPRRDGAEHAWHLYVVQLPPGADRRAVYRHMHQHGIGVQVHYVPLHRQPLFRQYVRPGQNFPVADGYYARCLTLPLFPAMTGADVERVVRVLREALDQ